MQLNIYIYTYLHARELFFIYKNLYIYIYQVYLRIIRRYTRYRIVHLYHCIIYFSFLAPVNAPLSQFPFFNILKLNFYISFILSGTFNFG